MRSIIRTYNQILLQIKDESIILTAFEALEDGVAGGLNQGLYCQHIIPI